ncbi:predicted protein [Naegleria gruberi]|uniref:Predicted protein n=1 Tax=Naegleria gruberi TaxID=5762 RepID=D2UZ72_NAEGR|nr:uncharacterized protein NAEGRDRAFT_61833 [Naegleria gruberi]EFC50102.1 predicted protein [Naegleria gruberi]|eukprot:XP_002682846.1 predicted protein [Naegleria gruberi strain NEG-M]
MIQEYSKTVDILYGNIYQVKIEDLESDSIENLTIYSKISHKNRVDQLLIILDHCQCVYNQYFIVNNDVQLYKYLTLSIKYGNVYENVKYLVYENSELKSKVLNYFICRECKTNYNNFKKYKQLKINILNSYIQSIINRLGVKTDYVNNYVIYLTQCVKYFQSFGHLRNINKYQQAMPKMIRLILTRNTHQFSHHCKLNYSEILNSIGQYDSSEILEQSLFLDHSVHPMQIFKYIKTQNEMYLLDLDQFIQILYEKLHKGKPLSQQKFYNYLIYKFGYFNNDLLIEKYNETQIILKQFIEQQISNIILSPQCFKEKEILKSILSKLNIESITKSDPNWQNHLSNLYQFLLLNAYNKIH